MRPTSLFRFTSTFILLLGIALLPRKAAAATSTLLASPAPLKFGEVLVGQAEKAPLSLTNTGASSTTLTAVNLGSGSEFSISGLNLPVVLAPGQTIAFTVTFSPTVAAWSGTTLAFTSTSSSLTIHVQGTGTKWGTISPVPSSLSFGSVSVGSSASLPIRLTNSSSRNFGIKGIQASGTGYSVSGPATPLNIPPGQSVTLNVSFKPSAAGAIAGSVFLYGPSIDIPLLGTGTTTAPPPVGQLAISPGSLNFGKVAVDGTGSLSTVLTATNGSVTVNSASSSNSRFALAQTSFPLTIASGQSVQVGVVFSPLSAGTASGTLAFSSNATNTGVAASLTGVGTVPQVSLSWSPSTSASGYNVYRGTAPGVYNRINSSLDASTSYTDMTVVSGTTYYYSATSVNTAGQESTYSSPVAVSVP